MIKKPDKKPSNPNFSSGPTTKRPNWLINNLEGALLGRSHRAGECKERLKKEEIEEGFSSSLVKKAVKIAADMGGDMSGAVKVIEKLKKGLSKDKAVVDALQLANEQKEGSSRVDGRTKGYREALRRIKIRQERKRAISKPVAEASGDKEAYKKFFDAALKKFDAENLGKKIAVAPAPIEVNRHIA